MAQNAYTCTCKACTPVKVVAIKAILHIYVYDHKKIVSALCKLTLLMMTTRRHAVEKAVDSKRYVAALGNETPSSITQCACRLRWLCSQCNMGMP